MRRLADYDEFRQGIPKGKKTPNLESGELHVTGVRYVRWKEFVDMQTSLESKIAEQTKLLERLLAVLVLFATVTTGTDIDEAGNEDSGD